MSEKDNGRSERSVTLTRRKRTPEEEKHYVWITARNLMISQGPSAEFKARKKKTPSVPDGLR